MDPLVEAAPGGAPRALGENLCWLLSRASHGLTVRQTAALEGIGLTPRAHCVLSAAMCGPRTQTDLARLVGLDKTTMVVTLDALERRGLAERRPSPRDRRVHVVAVTRAGARKVRQAADIMERVHAEVLAALPAGDRARFLDALSTLVADRLSEPVECPRPPRRRPPR